MQTATDTITVAGVQTPLLTVDQLEPGVLLTGIAMYHIWEVLQVTLSDVVLRKIDGPEPCEGEHALTVYGRGRVCSQCHVRIQDRKEFLPAKPNKPRVHLIQPIRAGCRKPEAFTVYGGVTSKGVVKLVHLLSNGMWSEPLPPFPAMVPIWSIPDALRALVSSTPDIMDVPSPPAPTPF